MRASRRRRGSFSAPSQNTNTPAITASPISPRNARLTGKRPVVIQDRSPWIPDRATARTTSTKVLVNPTARNPP